MKRLWLLIFVFSVFSSQAKLYYAESKRTHSIYFVEIDSLKAIVDVFKEGYRDDYSDWFFESMKKIGQTDIVYKGNRIWVRKDIGFLFVVDHIPGTKEAITVRLRETIIDGRTFSRERVYWDKKRKALRRTADSLSAANRRLDFQFRYTIQGNLHDDTLFTFKKRIDFIYDSLYAVIVNNKDPEVDYFYAVLDQAVCDDSAQVFERLRRANYKYRYADHMLRCIAHNRPEWLIRYVDKKPANEKKVLHAIRRSSAMKEMVRSVKKSPLTLRAKHKIVRQKNIYVAEGVLAGAAYCGLATAQFALIGLLVYAVSK